MNTLNKKEKGRFSVYSRRGLTLVELLVVLAIITAVAGIVIPIIPDSQQRSHGATGAGNVRELAKAVEVQKSSTGSFGNEWDSLIDSNPATVAPTDLVVEDLSSPGVGTVEEAIVNALVEAGIVTAYEHDDFSDPTVNQTFDGLTIALVDKLGSDEDVATLTAAGEDRLGLPGSVLNGVPASDIEAYVAFGVGQESTLVGRSLVDAPVQYPSGATNPTDHYSRFIAVFAVPVDGAPLRLATITGVEDLAGGDRLRRLGDYLDDYFNSFN
ncbi:MAG: prepilin-type N-terminal cleavage/methylation domain-containing protein [Verrucomicrobiota bacterium]